MRPTFFLVLPKKNVPRPVQEKARGADLMGYPFCFAADLAEVQFYQRMD